jgi:hypothetical protein
MWVVTYSSSMPPLTAILLHLRCVATWTAYLGKQCRRRVVAVSPLYTNRNVPDRGKAMSGRTQASFKVPCLSRGRACFVMVRRTLSAISLILLVFLWRPVSSSRCINLDLLQVKCFKLFHSLQRQTLETLPRLAPGHRFSTVLHSTCPNHSSRRDFLSRARHLRVDMHSSTFSHRSLSYRESECKSRAFVMRH